MGVQVGFNYQAWLARFPEFRSTVPGDTAQALFNEAQVYCRNDGGGPVRSALVQTTLLNYVTAHLAMLYFGTCADPPNSLVGRVSNATEGSVSVATEMDFPPGTPQWWMQTKYGASFWSASISYRNMRYIPHPTRVFNPFPFR